MVLEISSKDKACKHIKPDGRRCMAYTIRNSEYCFWHDPRTAKQRGEARARGGRTSTGSPVVLPTSEFRLDCLANIVDLLEETINQVRTGKLEVRVAQCTGYLAGIAIKAMEQAELERRIDALEQLMSKQRG